MMSCEKGKCPYSFFILLSQWHEFPAPKLRNIHYFIPFSFERDIKESLLDCTYKINYETGCIGRFFEKTQRCIQAHRDS